MRHLSRFLFLALLVGCGSSEPSDTHVELGRIDGGAGLRLVVAPEVFTATTPTDVVVNSFGSSSCTTPDHEDIARPEPMVYVVTVWDRVPDGDVPCTADYGERPHPITITYPQTGTGVLRVVGQRYDSTLQTVRRDTVSVSFPVMGRA